MKHDIETLLHILRTATLTERERDTMRNTLLFHVQLSSVRYTEDNRLRGVGGAHDPSLPGIITPKRLMNIIIGILIAATAGGGVSFAAEGTVPGDALYGIKIGVNEEVRGWANFSEETEADWQARLAERRLEEAETLAARSELNAETRTQLEARMEAHAQAAQQTATRLSEQNKARAASEVHSKLESTFRAHEQVLVQLQNTEQVNAEVRTQINGLLNAVRTQAQNAAQARAQSEVQAQAEASADVEVAAEGKVGAAQHAFDAAVRVYERKKAELSTEAQTQIESQIRTTEQVIAESESELEAENYNEAFLSAQAAVRQAHNIQVMTNSRIKIQAELGGVQVNISGDSEVQGNAETNTGGNSNSDGSGRNDGANGAGSQGSVNVEGGVEVEAGDNGVRGDAQATTSGALQAN